MQLTKDLKCSACGAVVNPNWKACIVCDHPLNDYRLIDPDDVEAMFKLLKMPLSQFKKGGYLIRVRCRHLGGEEVFIASSEKHAEIGRSEGLICYLPDELLHLIKGQATPEEVRAVHMVKKELGGTLIEAREITELKPAKKKGVR